MVVGLPLAMAASLVAGLAAGAGGALVVLFRTPSERWKALMMGFGAGVMLGAAVFSLLVPALALGDARWGSRVGGALDAAAGVVLGAAVVGGLNRLLPHEHFVKGLEGPTTALARAWLFVGAIAIHNVPEGLAMGVGFATGDLGVGVPLAIGIAFHNLPEGLVVAAALVQNGYDVRRAFGVALLTGLLEPLAALPGYLAVTSVQALLPTSLAFAAGAMVFVVSDEIIPESHRGTQSTAATWGVVAGFALMLVLDHAIA